MKNLILFLILLTALPVFPQISQPGVPFSIETKLHDHEVPFIELQKIDLKEIEKEDSLDELRNRPMRFGKAHDIIISSSKSGLWESFENKNIWRLKIKCPEALSINLLYDQFDLPEGGRFYIYNENKDYILGAFTDANEKEDGTFATGLVPGEIICLEYNGPVSVEPTISINRVVHGYRDFFNFQKTFGSSGSCNNNVNCPEGAPWLDQTNSVAMIVLAGGTRWCSGAMINNTCEDGNPYFLTANHCLTGSGVGNWMFYFNYQSPNCTNIDGPTNQIVTGASLISTSSQSDFALLELDDRPPLAYNVFYSGWSKSSGPADTVVAIHHPSGDIKKISFSNQVTQSTSYLQNSIDTASTHWRVVTWDDGTTEGGSSGSPLFNSKKQIIGQLHGGFASCSSITSDWYGKFSYSWDRGLTNNSRLDKWLDPALTGQDTLSGSYFSVLPSLDAAISEINNPIERSCLFTQVPDLSVKNIGLDTLLSLDIYFEILGGISDTIIWNGNVLPGESASIILDTITFNPGSYTLIAEILTTNGIADFNACNNIKSKSFEIVNGSEVQMKMRTDNWPEELSVGISDTMGSTIYLLSNFDANKLDSFFFCLEPGCYDITLYDSYGDGFTGASAFYQIIYNNSVLFSGNGAFGNCTGQAMPNGCFVTHRVCVDTNLVSQVPLASAAISDTVFLLGDTIQIFDNSSNFPNTWSWKIINDSVDYSFGTKNISFIASKVGFYDVQLIVSNTFGSDSVYLNDFFRVDFESALKETKEHLNVRIYPNPADGLLNIEVDNKVESTSCVIQNIQGKMIKEFRLSGGNNKVDISEIPSGVYLIKLDGSKTSEIIKVFIQ